MPSKSDLLAAATKTVPDVIVPDLSVLFCGINPGLYTAWVGHHFGRPGNRFWPAMFASGFTPTLFTPFQDVDLPPLGLGITNLVARATNQASELSRFELSAGKEILSQKVHKYHPHYLAVLGVQVYRQSFASPQAKVGLQPQKIGDTSVWLLPNPSGLNAHFTPTHLATLFRDLHQAVFG